MKRRGGFSTLIFACVPGCGEMYQGYMKRGFSICCIFWLIVAFGVLLDLEAVVCILPIIWLYSFFDTFNIRAQNDEQAEANPDGYLFGIDDMGAFSIAAKKRGKIIGWILVAIGVYALYTTFVGDILHNLAQYYEMWWLYDIMMYTVPRAVVIILIIGLGLWFIRGPKHAAEDGSEQEFQSFTPPASAAGPSGENSENSGKAENNAESKDSEDGKDE